MSRKLSIEEMCQIAEKRGGKCLSETYLNNHAPLLWECKIGHRWEATPKNIKRGAWCHSCGGSMKLTIEKMRGANFDKHMRPYDITDGGISVHSTRPIVQM